MLLNKVQELFWIFQFSYWYYFSSPRSNPGSHTAFSCHISLVSFNLWQFLSHCFSWPWRVLVMYFVEYPSFWIYLMFSHDLVEIMHYWERNQRNDAVSFAMHYIRGRTVLIYITCDLNLDTLARVGSAKILHWHLKFKTYFHTLKNIYSMFATCQRIH